MSDDFSDVIQTLKARRDAHAKSIETLDRAIADLTTLNGGVPSPIRNASPAAAPRASGSGFAPSGTKSVLQSILDLAAEGPKDWSAEEILAEYERRGQPIAVSDPMNAVFSALSRAKRKGWLTRVARGRYVDPQFAEGLSFEGEPDEGGALL